MLGDIKMWGIKHQPEGPQGGRSLLLDCGSYALTFLSDVYKKGTRAIKCQAEGLQGGRSMVEMLGVLAIIGVLSVGAIAGYSSAMMKHKLNKQAEQLSWMLNILYQYKSQWVFPSQKFVYLIPYYKKLGLIPEEMIKDDTSYAYDAFNMKLSMETNDCAKECQSVVLQYYVRNEHVPFEVCQNVFSTAVTFREQLHHFLLFSLGEKGAKHVYYGDKYCAKSVSCLKDIDLDKIYEVCQTLNNGKEFEPIFSFLIDD